MPEGNPKSASRLKYAVIGAIVLTGAVVVAGPKRILQHLHAVTASQASTPSQPKYVRPSVTGPDTAASWAKYQSNPVLGGNLGTCFDVSALKNGKNFLMWFSWRPKKSIAYVQSTDGIHWSDPVIALGPKPDTGWEDDINRPIVILHGGHFEMWYTGQAHDQSRIGMATSKDGKLWERKSVAPVLAPDAGWEKVAVMCPHVIWDGKSNNYKMWYSAGDQFEPDAIGYAESRDGLNWKKEPSNPVFSPDKTHSWEAKRVTGCFVFRDGSWYDMAYIGFHDDHFAQIGLARSADGIHNWERLPANPIIRPGNQPDSWDYDAVYKPSLVQDGNRWLLFYNGRKGDVEQVGMATHNGKSVWE